LGKNFIPPFNFSFGGMLLMQFYNPQESMKIKLHKAENRGHVHHGWLNAWHSFSFANCYDPEKMHFGVLRVLNDDIIEGGKGFGTHPHNNMEIITIPISGALEHKDSMDNSSVIEAGDVQVMSAGTGILHSEFNHNKNEQVKLLQIWVFPNQKNVEPRYDQISLSEIRKENEFYQILSPNPEDQGVWIHQNAWFNLGEFDGGWKGNFKLNDKTNGVYAFVIEGEINIAGHQLSKRDGLEIWETDNIEVRTDSGARVLLMEVPMR